MQIQAVDSRYPGASHDSFVWNISSARQYILNQYRTGDRTYRLLGDCGYGIEPFLLTPYRNPQFNSQQYKFNLAHSAARNIVERTIGVLKNRFRCLLGTLHYNPEKVVKVINVCCALHNICRHYKIVHNEDDTIIQASEVDEETYSNIQTLRTTEGERIRDAISFALC